MGVGKGVGSNEGEEASILGNGCKWDEMDFA